MQVDDAEDRRVAAVLALDVLADRADVVAEVLAAGRLDAAEDDGALTRGGVYAGSDRRRGLGSGSRSGRRAAAAASPAARAAALRARGSGATAGASRGAGCGCRAGRSRRRAIISAAAMPHARGGRPRSRRRRGDRSIERSPRPPGTSAGVAAGQRLLLGVGDRRRRLGLERRAAEVRSSSAEPNWAEITAPRTAIASSPATRETPLLTPEAMPTWRSSTESSTVAVSGATVAERPRPKTSDRRQHVGQVVGVGVDPEQQQQADAADDRADRHRQPRPGPRGERAEARREQEHQHESSGSSRGRPRAACSRRPAAGRG